MRQSGKTGLAFFIWWQLYARAGHTFFESEEIMEYCIVRYKDGQFSGVMAGCGRNRGTWDTGHSRSTAYRHARALRIEQQGFAYKVEPQH